MSDLGRIISIFDGCSFWLVVVVMAPPPGQMHKNLFSVNDDAVN